MNDSSAVLKIQEALRSLATELDLSRNQLSVLPKTLGQLTQLRALYLSWNKLTTVPEEVARLTQLQKLYLFTNELTVVPESLGQLTQLRSLNLAGNQLNTLPETLGQLTRLQSLNLSWNKLTAMPASLGQLAKLVSLNLEDNVLTALPESLGGLKQLKSLNVTRNRLTTLPESVGQLIHLQSLELSHNRLTELPESLSQLADLRSLDLSRNGLTALPDSLGQLAQLTSLKLVGNKLTALPESLGELAQLQSLYLSGNQLIALPDSLGNLAQLQSLELSGNQLRAMPKSLGRLTQLWQLDLSGNQIATLPDSMGDLAQLESLDASGNQLTALPESLGQLKHLSSLSLSSNRLKALPESLGQLKLLPSLDLSENKLAVLPESLGQLGQLWRLDLSGNELTALPESLGQLTQLKSLDVSRNQVTALPESLGQLTQLPSLVLRRNRLSALPESLGQLQQLPSLDLSQNKLTALPESIGNLAQLQSLDISDNQLTALPGSLGQLALLKSLDLSRNQLTALPESLDRLARAQLKEFYLHGNEGLGIPPEILGADRDAVSKGVRPTPPSKILEYYFATRGSQGSALRELKLLVVGRGGAGKTSLVKRLNRQPLDAKESETHGINISPFQLICSDGPVTARVWDFGGQHVLHAMHEFFLTARSLYLLVLGEREDMAERDAAYWLQLIRSYAGSAPVVVAINKNAGRPREMDRESLERNFGPILAWVPTECSEGFDETIEDLRAALTKAADGMKEVRDLFPAKWWSVKEWLENMEEPYLDFVTYQHRCGELGERDPLQQEKLASWLNDLGIAINYANDDRLRDTTVLRPVWLANGIYAILRANDPHHHRPLAPDATLSAAQLGPVYAGAERLKMLNAADYPPEKFPFLLQLMRHFQLAFPLDDAGEKLLVPSLLPIMPPPDCDEPQEGERTRLQYQFAVVPGPLLPKLLVRTFSLIDGERRWRRGAFLRFKEARARVWTTQDERWLRITAVGAEADRAELVTMVRVTLRKLIAEYENLQAVEQWEYKDDWVPRRTLEEMGVLSPDSGSNDGEDVQP